MASSKKTSKVRREIEALVFFSLAVFMGCCLISYNPSDPSFNVATTSSIRTIHNWGGIVGSYVADALFQCIGLAAFIIPISLLWVCLKIVFFKTPFTSRGVICYVLLIVSLAGLLSLILGRTTLVFATFTYELNGGGLVGSQVSGFSLRYFNLMGSYLLLSLLTIISFLVLTDVSLFSVAHTLRRLVGRWSQGVSQVLPFWRLVKGMMSGCFSTVLHAIQKLKEGLSGQRGNEGGIPQKEHEVSLPDIRSLSFPLRERGDSRNDGSASPMATRVRSREKTSSLREYQFPSLSFLDNPPQKVSRADREALRDNARVLENKLADFGIQGKVVEINPGPVITRYEFEPASGVRISRILGLADDLALALKACGIRILAPVPGKAVVGIEIPNAVRETVYFKEIVGREEFLNAQSKLTLALGKDIAGKPIITDLAKMPHLLIAGSTGSGKSVLINAMICSILYKATPSEVKMLLIDPKRLELSFYEDVPHLLHPVVTDPKKASVALQWTVGEMERRYHLLAEKGVRDIEGYNRMIVVQRSGRRVSEMGKEEGTPDESLPYILVVIDELADLMMVSSREVENSIARLAQMARAAGIHLLVATQRPSVDVLTGTIKVNFSARISFQVSSKVDSRTIIDTIGAERLLGRGDMLFLPPGTSTLVRVHGSYLSESEIRRIAEFWKKQGVPEYDQSILETKEKNVVEGEEEYDDRYDDAVALVVQTRMASISMIQRRLRIGYNRAARIIERMEREGVVGPSDGVKPREVLIKRL